MHTATAQAFKGLVHGRGLARRESRVQKRVKKSAIADLLWQIFTPRRRPNQSLAL